MIAAYSILTVTENYARDLAPWLRAPDLAEVEAAFGRPAEEIMLGSVGRDVWNETLIINGWRQAIRGLVAQSLLFGPCVMWMVARDRLTAPAR